VFAWRAGPRQGGNGCAWGGRPVMPRARRQGGPSVGPMRRKRARPCRQREAGGSVRAPRRATRVAALDPVRTAPRVEGGAAPGMGTAARAAHALGGSGPRLGAPCPAGPGDHPLPPHPPGPPGRPPCRPQRTRGLESVGPQRHARAASVGGGGGVRSARLPQRPPCHPSQEPRASRPAVGQARRPHRGPHVPADVGRAGVNGEGVCPAALSAQRSGHAPGSPGQPDQEDRHANGGATLEGFFGCVTDHRQDGRWGSNAASADAFATVTAGELTSIGVGDVSLPAARNAQYWQWIGRMVS
jgi:hypothetical protein